MLLVWTLMLLWFIHNFTVTGITSVVLSATTLTLWLLLRLLQKSLCWLWRLLLTYFPQLPQVAAQLTSIKGGLASQAPSEAQVLQRSPTPIASTHPPVNTTAYCMHNLFTLQYQYSFGIINPDIDDVMFIKILLQYPSNYQIVQITGWIDSLNILLFSHSIIIKSLWYFDISSAQLSLKY